MSKKTSAQVKTLEIKRVQGGVLVQSGLKGGRAKRKTAKR